MNLKNIIGLGLLAFFTNCDTPIVVTSVAPATCVHSPAVVQQPKPLPPLPICKPINPPSLQNVHVDEEGRVEKTTDRWTENGQLHETVQKEDADHNVHKVHRFVRNGKPCEIDEWVDSKSGASVHSHKYISGEDNCLHEVRIATDVQGKSEQKHYRKDQQGNVCQVTNGSNASQSSAYSRPTGGAVTPVVYSSNLQHQ